MTEINYGWTEEVSETDEFLTETIFIDETAEKQTKDGPELASRHDIQIMRRLFHMFNGFSIATLYLVSFSHSQMVHFLGTIACALYLVEQVRVNYPETAAKLLPFTKFIIRAEEQLKESAMVPFCMAVLFTIVVFPKHIALIGIYSLGFADPLSAIIGIRFGKHKISPTRSYEGSAAFFVSVFLISLFILTGYNGSFDLTVFFVSLLGAVICALFEIVPLKLDDNLTIPLFTAATFWIILSIFGVYI